MPFLTPQRTHLVLNVAVAIVCLTPSVSAQTSWHTYATAHFQIFYEPPLAGDVDRVAVEAERAYARLSNDLGHELDHRVPLILLDSTRDLPVTPDQAIDIIRSSGAPNRDHVLLPAQPADEREGMLTHELTHQFEFELIPLTPHTPRWLYEGLSEHERGRWVSSGPLPVAAGQVPAITELTSVDRNWGRAVFDFIDDEFGTDGVRRYLSAVKTVSTHENAVQQAFGLTADEFQRAFARFIMTGR